MPEPFALSLLETRILGTLLEKQRTVPDTYPLSLNALLAGCNQKSSRNPVMEIQESALPPALESLRDQGLLEEIGGSRVSRYGHRLERALGIPGQSAALLAVLMLRGPQTAGELRLNSERLHRFADISAVEAFLDELASRPEGPLVVQLPRLPGARENRWMHLLGGQPENLSTAPAAPETGEMAALQRRIETLEAEVAELQSFVKAMQGR